MGEGRTAGSAAKSAAAVLALVAVMLLGTAVKASAHASVVSTTPGDGTVLNTAPATVSVAFDQPVTAGTGALRVIAPDGTRADTGPPFHPGGHGDELAVTVAGGSASGAARGTYTVAWRVVSSDSHPVSGGFTYSVGVATTAAVTRADLGPGGSRAVGVTYGVARWTAYAGFAALVGGSVFVLGCWPAGRGLRRTRQMLGAAWGLTVAGTLASLMLQGPYGAGLGFGSAASQVGDTLRIRFGLAAAVRLGLLVGAVPVLALLLGRRWDGDRRLPGRVALRVTAGLLAIALSLTWVAADHGGTGSQVAAAMPISALHLLAMAVWLGGVAFLAAVALPAGDPGPAVRRFSQLAFICICVLAASGLYEAWRGVGSWAALADTAYGRLIIGKAAGFAVVIGLGATARRAVSRRALPRLRELVVTEIAVGISVLALTAVLVEVQPGRTAYTPPVHATAAFDTGGPHGGGTASLVVDPPKVGIATFDLAVVDTRRAPVREAQISAALQLDAQRIGPLPVTFTDVGTGHYEAIAPVTMAGAWVLRVTVRSDALNETTVAFPVKVR